MLVALLDQFFENYTTFSLSVLYQKKKKKKRTKSKLCICCQLSMKSSSFWDTYLLWQNIIKDWIQDKKQWLVVSTCKFLFAAILLPVKAGIINDAIITKGVPSPLDNERFYTAPSSSKTLKPENRHDPWTEFENNRTWRPNKSRL